MALFKRFFYRKPPDGLLEISDRVFVFDCCFSADIMDDDEYKTYLGGIVAQLREYYTDASFMAFNFREGNKQSHLANLLSEYDVTVMDYPRQYETCPLLTMEMLHHFLRSCESWILLGQRNVLLMHCERGGWPILAFMLAALLIYRKQYTGEQKTLEMIYKQAPRELLQLLSPLDPSPSQLRYLQYISRRSLGSEWPPLDRALTMDCIILRFIPNMDGEGGCRPIFRIYGPDPLMVADPTPKVLFSTPKRSKVVRHYKQADCQLVKIDINCHIQGDVVLECISLDSDLERERMMFRIMFNTAFIRSNILMLNRDEVDLLWNGKDRFPKDFRAEVIFSDMDSTSSPVMLDVPDINGDGGLPVEAFAKVKEIFSTVDWLDTKRDVALNVLQKITSANILQETLESGLLGATDNQLKFFPPINSSDNLSHEQNLAEDAEKPSPKVTVDGVTRTPSLSLGEQLLDSLETSPDLNLAFKKTGSHGLHILTQRILQTSLSTPTFHTQQASPMSISRYHSAPFLGITALLHDHVEPKAKEVYLSAKTSPVGSGSSSPEHVCSPAQFTINSNLEFSQSPSSLLPSEATTMKNAKTGLDSSPFVSELDSGSSKASSSKMDAISSLSISSLPLPIESATSSEFFATPPPPPQTPPQLPHLPSDPEPLHTSVMQHSRSSNVGITRSSSAPPPTPPPSFSGNSSMPSSKSLSSLATLAPPSTTSSAIPRNLKRPSAPLPKSSKVLSQSTNNLTPITPSPPPPIPPVSHHVNSSDSSQLLVKRSVDVAPPPPPPPPPLCPKPAGPTESTAPPPPPPPPLCSKPAGSTESTAPPPPPPPPQPCTESTAPPPPPPPQPCTESTAPPPPPAPNFASKGPLNKISMPVPPPPSPSGSGLLKAPVPPVPPPPSPTGSGLLKAGGTASSNGNIPPIPGPLLNAKGRLNLRAGSKNQGQSSKKSNLKPYHWLKLTRAMQGSLWAETQKSDEAAKAPEFDMSELESLFSIAPNSDLGSRGSSNRRASAAKPEKVSLIDFRRAYNCEIMLTKVKIPLPDMMNAVLALDDSALDIDQVENLIKFCPTKEEMELLKNYRGDKENLGKCEQFFLELMKVPRVEAKLRVFAFKIQFCSQVSDLRKCLNAVNSTSEEVRNSAKLKRIMQTILSLGNALNQGTARGSAVGFRLDSLLKLTDTRARNNKLTLMHYLCKVLAEKLPELLDFHKDLVTLEISTKIQLKYLAEEMQAISKGLEKIVQELTASESDGPVSETFCQILKEFLGFAEAEVRSLASLYSIVGKNADALALYFGEDPARCPFEQVVSTLRNFVRMFVRAHEENCKQIELEKKKAQKEEENEKKSSATIKRPEMETMKSKECSEQLIKT